MNVLFIYEKAINPLTGGAERITFLLASYLESEGCKVSFMGVANEQAINDERQVFLPDPTSPVSDINISFYLNYLDKNKANYALLHCNSTYPAPVQDINLNFLPTLKKIHNTVGYSGHERGINVTLAAVALGASIVERHFTLDRLMEGPDHAASLEFEEFKSLVLGIREIEKALGNGNYRALSQGEMINRENLGKSLVAARELQKGDIITAADIKILSPGQGLSPQNFENLLGKKLHRDVNFEDYFFKTDLALKESFKTSFNFQFKWGIPVRYHDFLKFNEIVEPDLYEFHLSYSDMELDPSDSLKGPYESGFVVQQCHYTI